jgi:hypothetical protein
VNRHPQTARHVPGHHDLAVRLHQHGPQDAVARQRHASVAVEVRVEIAARAQPRDRCAAERGLTGDEKAAVGLACQREAELGAAEVHRGPAGGAEGLVQRSVRIQAGDLHVAALGPREAAHEQLAVGQHEHVRRVAERPPAERLLAVAVEAGVERAVAVQPRDGDVEVRASDEHDLAVRLQRSAEGVLVVAAESDPSSSAGAERGVERAVGLQAGHAERVRRPAPARHDDPPVRLHQHHRGRIDSAEVDRPLAIAGEARVEITRGHLPTLPGAHTL